MSIRSVVIHTDESGGFTYERALSGAIYGVEVKLGSGGTALSTPDVDITDGVYGTSVLSVNGVASDTVYNPSAFLQDDGGADVEVDTGVKAAGPVVVMGTLKIVVAGGGDSKRGRINVLYQN